MPKVRRTSYNLAFKLKIVAETEAVENNSEIAREYGISESMVRRWRKDQENLFDGEIKKSAKRKTMGCFTPKYPEVDQRLLEWFSEQRSQGIAVGGLMLRLKAKEFYYDPALKASVGWYINWKPSHSFTLRTKDHPRPASAKRSRRANSKIPPVRDRRSSAPWIPFVQNFQYG
ncbi:jerky protein homolog-like [Stylophora pistillata]|uniref:jerky protein homolog-like n=1 Tax=Stylophora pistillata TaxID=50429 RepID=UPI000C04F312|nr:jerky protein homolog-like [Stylophora pistillata]